MSGRPPGAVSLADILAELQLIRQANEGQQRQPSTLSRGDRATLARLLPVLGATYGEDGFTSRDCAEDEVPGLRLVVRQMSAKAIGKLLARADGVAINALTVQRQRTEFQVIVWHVATC